MIIDQHHRVHNYLRISLTDACNFRCFYCMPNEEIDVTPHSKLMSKDEIIQIATLFVQLGVTKIRLTGGEPLVRKDFDDIVKALSRLPVKLALTTNAVLIDQHWEVLKSAGLTSINISLDTLDEHKFELLTKRNQFQKVYDNIQLLLSHRFSVKINMVVLKGINDQEINTFIAWTKHQPIHVRFIEFMPFTSNQWHSEKVFTYQDILQTASSEFEFIKLKDEVNATTKKYKVLNHQGTFAIISTMTAPFCSTCNRLRLTADGKLKNCLFSKEETDILTPFRLGEDIAERIHQNVKAKHAMLGGQLALDYELNDDHLIDNRSMIRIGG